MKFYSGKNTEVPALYIKEKDGTESLALLNCEMSQVEEVAKAEIMKLPFAKLRKIEKAQAVRLDLFGGYYSNDGGEWIHEDSTERKGFYRDFLPEIVQMLNPNNSVKCYKLTYVLPNDRITEFWYEGELPSTYFYQKEDWLLNGFICVKCDEELGGWTLLNDDPSFILDRLLGSNGEDEIDREEFNNAVHELDKNQSITLKTANGNDLIVKKCDLPEVDVKRTIEDNSWSIKDLNSVFINGKNLLAMYADGEI